MSHQPPGHGSAPIWTGPRRPRTPLSPIAKVVVVAASVAVLWFVGQVLMVAVGMFVMPRYDDTDVARDQLRAAARELDDYHDEHGHYSPRALDHPERWSAASIPVEAHIPDDGSTYCLEAYLDGDLAPLGTHDSTRGYSPDLPCNDA